MLRSSGKYSSSSEKVSLDNVSSADFHIFVGYGKTI